MSLLLLFKPLKTGRHGGVSEKRKGGKKKKKESYTITQTKKGIEVRNELNQVITIDNELAEGILLFIMMDDND